MLQSQFPKDSVIFLSPIPDQKYHKNPRLFVRLKRADGIWRTYKVINYRCFRNGTVYRYKVQGTIHLCIAWIGYQPDIVNGNYVIPQIEGSLAPAAPLEMIPTLSEEYYALYNTNLQTHATRTMRGGINIPWIPLMIVVGVIVVAIVAYMIVGQVAGNDNVPTPTPSPTVIRG